MAVRAVAAAAAAAVAALRRRQLGEDGVPGRELVKTVHLAEGSAG